MILESDRQREYSRGYDDGFEEADAHTVKDLSPVSNARVYGLNNSIRRAKYPMSVDINSLSNKITKGIEKLAMSKSGAGHDQWLTGVIVQFDLTFSNKAWVESERYHFLDFVSSQSTMHKITSFDLKSSFIKYVDPRIIDILQEKIDTYNDLVQELNSGNKEIKDLKERVAEAYLEILYNVPAGFRLTAGMTTNYRQLKTIYAQRKDHRLPEWRAFCRWIETLPMSWLITGVKF